MEIKQIPISLVTPSPMNPRKTFDEEELRELAENIEKQGLLQPITVRPTLDTVNGPDTGEAPAPGKFEIVCGERRFRAVSMLKAKEDALNVEKAAAHRKKSDRFQTIAAIVREMTDEEAFDAMITENLQRKDVDPIEEAFAFGQLVEKGKTPEEIAARFGKSIRFVTERIKLNTLIPELMLAVKDEKMPIVAAQIICKLDEDEQKKYYSNYSNNYQGFTKSSAQSFVDNLFMTLEKSLWYQSDNQEDESFTGGCDCECSQCPFNTTNHGCLFYEMKREDAGRCTNRDKFRAKTIAFMLYEIERQSERMVKVGEPLDFGKTVIAIKTDDYEGEESKSFKKQVTELLTAKGYEVVNPDKIFRSKCYYSNDDERTIEMIKTGEVYRVISLFNYTSTTIDEQFWYVKKNVTTADGDEAPANGVPANVTMILDSLKAKTDYLPTSFTIECAKTMAEHSTATNEPLTELEKKMFCLLVIQSNFKLRKQFDLGAASYRDEEYKLIKKNPDIFNQCVRAWLQSKVTLGNNPELRQAEPLLDELGALWCPEEYQKAKDKVQAKYDKDVAKITKQLADLGYGIDGKPLVVNEDVPPVKTTSAPAFELFQSMKAKHPDAVVLFRVGDFYEAYHEDAETLGEICGLNVSWVIEQPSVKMSGFVHHAIDTYLPKLIRAGKRVAICEQLESPKK